MKKNIGLLVITFLLSHSGFGQCLVNYKDAMKDFKGEYLHHLEVNNLNSQEFSLILNGGSAYYFYVFNTSHKTTDYHLFQNIDGELKELSLQEKSKDYLLYRIKQENVNRVEFSLLVESKEKACAVIAVMYASDYEELTVQYAKNKSDNPPGTVRVNEKLFADKVEVRNVDYRQYMYWLQEQFGKESEEYKGALPDTNCWRAELAYNEPLAEYYFRHPAYAEYPVVGNSYEQAVAFCQWRSDRVNVMAYWEENKYLDKNKLDKNPKNVPQVFKYRLPTRQEWESLARIGYSESQLRKMNNGLVKGCVMANFASSDIASLYEFRKKMGLLNDNADITAPVGSYYSNKIGMHSLMGNVAEMIDEKGIAKGGSWVHEREEVTVGKDFEYTQPEPWLGFRCVCERVNFPPITINKEKVDTDETVLIKQSNDEEILIYARKKSDNPPGTVRVAEKMYADKTEIRNVDYREYLHWLQSNFGKESKEYQLSLPDTNCWIRDERLNEPMAEKYSWHPAYAEYPVIGVSYEQAVAYCEWRSDRVNVLRYWKKNKYLDIKNLDLTMENVPQVFKYRLPTNEEWETFANIGLEDDLKRNARYYGEYWNFYSEVLTDEKGKRYLADGALHTNVVDWYPSNLIGQKNIIGNVAEMTNEKGIAKGGSWIHKREEYSVEKDYTYTKPESWLGFRCVCDRVD